MGLFTFIVKKIYEGKEEKPAPVSAGDRVVLYAPGDRVVLYAPGSKVYHLDDSCLGFNTEPKKVKEKQALKMGLRICKRCEKNI